MTLYGIDVASYQAGLNLAEVKAESFDFIIAKATQGSGYVDPSWASFRDGADANDLILVAYHYVTLDAAAAQAENLVSALGDTGIPVMLDFEAPATLPTSGQSPTRSRPLARTSHCPTFRAGTGSRSAHPT